MAWFWSVCGTQLAQRHWYNATTGDDSGKGECFPEPMLFPKYQTGRSPVWYLYHLLKYYFELAIFSGSRHRKLGEDLRLYLLIILCMLPYANTILTILVCMLYHAAPWHFEYEMPTCTGFFETVTCNQSGPLTIISSNTPCGR